MRSLFASLCLTLFLIGNAAALDFPILTGRVVDDAHILSPGVKQQLEQALTDYEHRTSTQIVVVTTPSLQGLTIEDYGVQLGRHWGIGQKDKNNGILLIIAPNEREVRIEVGYGLEGDMTDAIAKQIITSVILPHFRENRMEEGILRGTETILGILGGEKIATPLTPDESASGDKPFFPELPPLNGWHIFALIMSLSAFVALCIRYPKIFWILLAGLVFVLKSGKTSSGSSSSGSRSGGGGSFGGGGASGKW